MAPRKMKVFRTAIGFHDAYVAAPSQKAALDAWGSDHDLFASGRAELVTDETLAEAALVEPGRVIKRPRGSAKEHLSALAATPPRRKEARKSDEATAPPEPLPRPESNRRKPRPSRAAVDKAEAALIEAEREREVALSAIADEQARLDERRRAEEGEHRRRIDRLSRDVERARARHRAALTDWRGQS